MAVSFGNTVKPKLLTMEQKQNNLGICFQAFPLKASPALESFSILIRILKFLSDHNPSFSSDIPLSFSLL